MRTLMVVVAGTMGLALSNADAEGQPKFFEAAKAECARLHPQVYTDQKSCIEDYTKVHQWAERAQLLTTDGQLDRVAIQHRSQAKDSKAIILGQCIEKWWSDTAPGRWPMTEYCVRTEQEAYEAIYGKLFK